VTVFGEIPERFPVLVLVESSFLVGVTLSFGLLGEESVDVDLVNGVGNGVEMSAGGVVGSLVGLNGEHVVKSVGGRFGVASGRENKGEDEGKQLDPMEEENKSRDVRTR
jgi:hypothetical protein